MWLLNATTRKLEYFHTTDAPPYAALSHRWQDEEVSFDDIATERAVKMKGYSKIDMCCQRALNHGASLLDEENVISLKYIWVDTCCIDKRSSAELSEAINSMYKWYAQAAICYAYLSDVDSVSEFEDSLWFTRGWTLQELLAPQRVIFFDSAWNTLGLKNKCKHYRDHIDNCDHTCLVSRLQSRTTIPLTALQNFRSVDYSIAERMSWASSRVTTREEDIAYCLLGIFNINMPMLYGEGVGAFRRLQEEIVNISNDMSILIWSGSPATGLEIFAQSPSCFKMPDPDIEDIWRMREIFGRLPLAEGFTLNNAGLSLTLAVEPYSPLVLVAYLQDIDVTDIADIANSSRPRTISSTRTRPTFAHSSVWVGMLLKKAPGEKTFRRIIINGENWIVQEAEQVKQRAALWMSRLRISRDRILYTNLSTIRIRLLCPQDHFSLFQRVNGMLSVSEGWEELTYDDATPGKYTEFRVEPLDVAGFNCCMTLTNRQDETLTIFLGFDLDARPLCFMRLLKSKEKNPFISADNRSLLKFAKAAQSTGNASALSFYADEEEYRAEPTSACFGIAGTFELQDWGYIVEFNSHGNQADSGCFGYCFP